MIIKKKYRFNTSKEKLRTSLKLFPLFPLTTQIVGRHVGTIKRDTNMVDVYEVNLFWRVGVLKEPEIFPVVSVFLLLIILLFYDYFIILLSIILSLMKTKN